MTRGMRVWFVGIAAIVLCSERALALYTPNPAGRWAEGHFFLAGDFTYNTSKDLDPVGEIDDQVGFFARPAFSIAPNVMLYGRLG
ncbi:MAG: hypothetical protein ACREQQ_08100, partial [Candidatus Binatia bacterium]